MRSPGLHLTQELRAILELRVKLPGWPLHMLTMNLSPREVKGLSQGRTAGSWLIKVKQKGWSLTQLWAPHPDTLPVWTAPLLGPYGRSGCLSSASWKGHSQFSAGATDEKEATSVPKAAEKLSPSGEDKEGQHWTILKPSARSLERQTEITLKWQVHSWFT